MRYLAAIALLAIPRPLLDRIEIPHISWRNLLRTTLLWLAAAAVFTFWMSIYLFGGDY